MEKEIKFREESRGLIATLEPEIDHHTARRMRERIDSELFRRKSGVLILDFSNVRFMDSSGIGLILGRCEICDQLGIHVRIEGLSSTNKKLIRLAGLEKLKNLTVG